jgi:predicted AAA+ superfamily ATPase
LIDHLGKEENSKIMHENGRVRAVTAVDERIQTTLHAVHGLTLLRGIFDDHTGKAVLHLLQKLVPSDFDAAEIATAYSHAFHELVMFVQNEEVAFLPDAWQAYLVNRLLDYDNPWSRLVERYGSARIPAALRQQAERDLRVLQLLFQITAETFLRLTQERVSAVMPVLHDAWVPWCNLGISTETEASSTRGALVQHIAECDDWATFISPLEMYWARHGVGPLAHYHVFRWLGSAEGLQGIAHPDPVQLSNLIGYGREQARLKVNTERFLAGLPAHDTLLYGPPGTGKSSTVKALVNAYADRGLRLVEVRKEYLGDLPQIVSQLRDRAPRFLLFIDDLSFEEHEVEYKVLKMLLEGTAEARPANVLVYATTNRMNLVREYFTDRGKPTEDVNWRDTMEEKQSLAHRFGLRVTFMSPDQERYLSIALGLARQRGITLSEEALRERALHWERQHVGRSGRVARQFVDELEAELKKEQV